MAYRPGDTITRPDGSTFVMRGVIPPPTNQPPPVSPYTYGNGATVTTPDGRTIHRPAPPPANPMTPINPIAQQQAPQTPPYTPPVVIGNAASLFPPQQHTVPSMPLFNPQTMPVQWPWNNQGPPPQNVPQQAFTPQWNNAQPVSGQVPSSNPTMGMIGPQMRIPGNNQSLSSRLLNNGPISPANRRR